MFVVEISNCMFKLSLKTQQEKICIHFKLKTDKHNVFKWAKDNSQTHKYTKLKRYNI